VLGLNSGEAVINVWMPVNLVKAESVVVCIGSDLSDQTPVNRGDPYLCVKCAVIVKPAHRGIWIKTRCLYSISVVTSVFLLIKISRVRFIGRLLINTGIYNKHTIKEMKISEENRQKALCVY